VLFVLSLVILQVTADNLLGPVFTLGPVAVAGSDDGLSIGKRARKADYQAHPAGELVCRPFGLCEPCPVDEVSILECSSSFFWPGLVHVPNPLRGVISVAPEEDQVWHGENQMDRNHLIA